MYFVVFYLRVLFPLLPSSTQLPMRHPPFLHASPLSSFEGRCSMLRRLAPSRRREPFMPRRPNGATVCACPPKTPPPLFPSPSLVTAACSRAPPHRQGAAGTPHRRTGPSRHSPRARAARGGRLISTRAMARTKEHAKRHAPPAVNANG